MGEEEVDNDEFAIGNRTGWRGINWLCWSTTIGMSAKALTSDGEEGREKKDTKGSWWAGCKSIVRFIYGENGLLHGEVNSHLLYSPIPPNTVLHRRFE